MSELHHSNKWHKLRDAIMRRNKGMCANPFGLHMNKGMITPNGEPTIATDVHHIEPVEVAPNKIYKASNLVPLCKCCHRLAHLLIETDRQQYRKAFKLPLDVPLTISEAQKEQQDFFERKECRKLESGKWHCARMGKDVDMPCPVCRFNR